MLSISMPAANNVLSRTLELTSVSKLIQQYKDRTQ